MASQTTTAVFQRGGMAGGAAACACGECLELVLATTSIVSSAADRPQARFGWLSRACRLQQIATRVLSPFLAEDEARFWPGSMLGSIRSALAS